jgi:flagellar FliL protein
MSSPAVAAAPDARAAPKKSKKMLFIITAAVVLLGGGAGAFFFMKGGDKAKEGEHKEAKVEPRGPAIYVGLEPPFVVNFEATENVRFLQIAVQVMTRDAHIAEVIKNNDPVIRNDLLLLFGSQKSADVASLEGKEKLRGEALEVIRKIVAAEAGTGPEKEKEGHKPGEVEAVYFTSFVMQ